MSTWQRSQFLVSLSKILPTPLQESLSSMATSLRGRIWPTLWRSSNGKGLMPSIVVTWVKVSSKWWVNVDRLVPFYQQTVCLLNALCGSPYHASQGRLVAGGSRLFPDTSLVKASAPESRSATRWPHLRYPIAERSGHGHAAAAASSKL